MKEKKEGKERGEGGEKLVEKGKEQGKSAVPLMSSTEHVVASPAAAVLERRLSRTTPEKRKQPCRDSESEESETGSDGEWTADDDPLSDHGREDEDEEEDEAVLRGRVRPHAVVQGSKMAPTSLFAGIVT